MALTYSRKTAKRKLTHFEGRIIRHIYNVFKNSITICAEAVRVSSAIQAPDYIALPIISSHILS